MIDFLISLIAGNAPLLVSILALAVSLISGSLAKKSLRFAKDAHRQAERAKIYEKRSEILSEIDRQHARCGSLLVVLAEKIVLFQQNPWLAENFPKEYARLSENLKAIGHLRACYEEQRNISVEVREGADSAAQESAIAEIRRLTIHIDEDIKQEEHDLNEIKRLVSDKSA